MGNLSEIKSLNANLPLQDFLMPVLFIGHGSPMNGIENNEFSNGLK
jgi:4,5-DOPA dioxygenase extradiol